MKRSLDLKKTCLVAALAAVVAVGSLQVFNEEKEKSNKDNTQQFKTRQADGPSVTTAAGNSSSVQEVPQKAFKLPKSVEYFADDMSEEQKRAFASVYDGICNFEETIEIDGSVIERDNADDFISAILAQSPDVDQIGSSYSISFDSDGIVNSINLEYIMTKEEYDSRQAELDAKADEILSGMNEGWSDYRKVMYLHDTIADICYYSDEGTDPYSAYGCLVEGKAVCQGYSKAMQTLCLRAGIDCICVSGFASDPNGAQSHIWNKIRIDDVWANFDVTWDDPLTSTGLPYLRYDYFGLTDDEISYDHTPDENEYINYPEADSTELNYYTKTGLYYDGAASAEDVMSFSVLSSMSSGDNTARMKCADADLYNQAVAELFGDYTGSGAKIYGILADAVAQTGSGWSSSEFAFIKNDGLYTITVFFR